MKRIRFNERMDIVLLKSIIAVKAHVAERGMSQRKFEETLKVYVGNVRLNNGVTSPTWRTLYERFKRVVADHCIDTRQLEASSGVAEEVTERTQLLDDIIHEMDEFTEQCPLERQDKIQRDKDLQGAGERIRAHAIGSTSDALQTSETGDHENYNEPSDMPRLKRRRRQMYYSDEESDLIRSHLASRHSAEEARAKAVDHRLEFEMQQSERRIPMESQRMEFEKLQNERRQRLEDRQGELEARRLEIDKRRLYNDEKRLSIESEDRKGLSEERKQILGVPSILVNKVS